MEKRKKIQHVNGEFQLPEPIMQGRPKHPVNIGRSLYNLGAHPASRRRQGLIPGFPMDKGKNIEAVNGEFLLPEAIIQHIQSFLSRKEAAQTSILSKYWYSAWSTSPNLDFDQGDFERPPIYQDVKGFWESVKKTMQRYEELKLKIESFRLCAFESLNTNELILKAMKMGATHLSLDLRTARTPEFILPHEVLESETLISLSVENCRIDLGVDEKVRRSKLKTLRLRRVFFEGDVFRDIILSCPFIEELSVSDCMYFVEVQNSNVVTTQTRSLELSPINQHEFHKLKYLVLEYVDIDNLFFGDFSSKFPFLKDLSVNCCYGYNEIQISSCSLECISFAQTTILRANFDVPSIRRFKFWGSDLPSLSFTTASSEWVSDITISCILHSNASWFLQFKKFLIGLSPSRISLTLGVCSIGSAYVGDLKVLPKPRVENLMVFPLSSVCSDLFWLEGLFWSCRPKFITHSWFPKPDTGRNANNDFLESLCKRLVQGVRENCLIPNQNMSGLHDLEEINVEIFEESLAEWRALPWKTLLDASESPKKQQKIRFKLRWGQEPVTSK